MGLWLASPDFLAEMTDSSKMASICVILIARCEKRLANYMDPMDMSVQAFILLGGALFRSAFLSVENHVGLRCIRRQDFSTELGV